MLYTGQGTAIVANNYSLSYHEFRQKINMFSEPLKEVKGKVLIFGENCEAWVCAFYAIWNNSLMAIPVDSSSVKAEFQYIVNDCHPEVVFYTEKQKEFVQEALSEINFPVKAINITEIHSKDFTEYPATYKEVENKQDTAVIIYTSGTTGSPKGVMLSFENLLINIAGVTTEVPIYTPKDCLLILLPLHHILPLMGTIIMPLHIGARIAISPSMISEDIIKTLQQNKVSLVIGVPRLYAAIWKGINVKIEKSIAAKLLFYISKKIKSLRFSRIIFASVQRKFGGAIKYFVSGGAALDPEIASNFYTLGFEIIEGYGMTEAAPMIAFNRPGKTKFGSVGEALPGCKVEAINGEIVAQGKNIMLGYFGREAETKQVLNNGKLYTGDLGYINKKGHIYLTGRKKEIIVLSNGKNINPAEIESKIQEIHPIIGEIAIIQEGDRLRAIIYPDTKTAVQQSISNIEFFIKWNVLSPYNKTVSSYKAVNIFTLSNTELPKTKLGKIQRYKLCNLEILPAKNQNEILQKYTSEFILIKDFLAQEKYTNVKPTDHIEFDLSLDSLDKVSLQVFIESTFGIRLEMNQLVAFENLQQLSDYISTHKIRSVFEKINWTEILQQKIHLKLPKTWITSNIVVKLFHIFFKIYFRYKGVGIKNIPNEACIIVPNHQSFLDGLFVASFLKYKQMRRTFFYAKEKHIRNPLLKLIANRNNVIIMDLNKNLKESIQKMAEVLKTERNLIIFPEGTRTSDGNLGEFKKTFAILSKELNIPVVPVSIKGAYEAYSRHTLFPKPFKEIQVEFLQAVYPGEHTYESLSETVREKIQACLEKE